MEHLILKVLSFDLAAPTINQFLTQYFLHQQTDAKVESLSMVSKNYQLSPCNWRVLLQVFIAHVYTYVCITYKHLMNCAPPEVLPHCKTNTPIATVNLGYSMLITGWHLAWLKHTPLLRAGRD